jgi:hypothetical protein
MEPGKSAAVPVQKSFLNQFVALKFFREGQKNGIVIEENLKFLSYKILSILQ